MKAFCVYFRGVYARARFMLHEAAKELNWLDLLCTGAAVVAVAYMVLNPASLGHFASQGLAGRGIYQALRGLIIALGVLILIDRRANTPLTKIAVALIVVGLAANNAENSMTINPNGIPLKFGYLMANSGILLWFLSILFRVPWKERAEQLQHELEDAYAQGFRPRK